MTSANSLNQSLVTTLVSALEGANGKAGVWLASQLRGVTSSTLASAFSWAGRKVGQLPPLDVTVPDVPSPEAGWDAALCARLALLMQFADSHPPAEQHRVVADLFYRGDTAERCAVLRCLPLLAEPARYLLIATDSVRSHVHPVLEAIACENPFPMLHFDEPAFNQLVMKVYFTGLPARRIVGLSRRTNAELSRMASDFAAERTAAGRPVPSDLSLVIGSS